MNNLLAVLGIVSIASALTISRVRANNTQASTVTSSTAHSAMAKPIYLVRERYRQKEMQGYRN